MSADEKDKNKTHPPNITDTYHFNWCVDDVLKEKNIDRTSTITMADAIGLSQTDFSHNAKLSDDQKRLIAIVAEERKTEDGKILTQRAADNGDWLAFKHDRLMEMFTSGEMGKYYGKQDLNWSNPDGMAVIHDTGDLKTLAATTQHEETHGEQERNTHMPQGLSSYAQGLWNLGTEAQAFVVQAEYLAEREGKTLSDEQKREIFSTLKDGFESELERYKKDAGIDKLSRTDGRNLTIAEFEKAFGFLPGHEDKNFLQGGNFTSVEQIFAEQPSMLLEIMKQLLHIAQEQKPAPDHATPEAQMAAVRETLAPFQQSAASDKSYQSVPPNGKTANHSLA